MVSPYIVTSSRNSVVTLYPCKTTVERVEGGCVTQLSGVLILYLLHTVCHPVLVSPPWVQTYR